jgi:hypothetical protein
MEASEMTNKELAASVLKTLKDDAGALWKELKKAEKDDMKVVTERLAVEVLGLTAATTKKQKLKHERNILHLRAQVDLALARLSIKTAKAVKQALKQAFKKVLSYGVSLLIAAL